MEQVFFNVPLSKLEPIFKRWVKEAQTELQPTKVEQPDELLTREQTCKFLQIDSSTLWRYTNEGKITAYGIGNRRYYKKAELLDALKPLKK